MSKEVKAAWISGICVIIAAIIGIFNYNLNKSNETLKTENAELIEENYDWESAYNKLQEQFDELNHKNTSLSNELDKLKESMGQYSSLETENESLKKEVSELQNEIQLLNNTEFQEHEEQNEQDFLSNNTGKKVSIFDLETFRGNSNWNSRSDLLDFYFIDTYGNEYLNAYIGVHDPYNKESKYNPTYLLEQKYSMCEGQMAFSKAEKNTEGSVWIEFYSDNELIYTTESINADSRLLDFKFDVSKVEKLTIILNGTEYINVVYPYLNLIE